MNSPSRAETNSAALTATASIALWGSHVPDLLQPSSNLPAWCCQGEAELGLQHLLLEPIVPESIFSAGLHRLTVFTDNTSHWARYHPKQIPQSGVRPCQRFCRISGTTRTAGGSSLSLEAFSGGTRTPQAPGTCLNLLADAEQLLWQPK